MIELIFFGITGVILIIISYLCYQTEVVDVIHTPTYLILKLKNKNTLIIKKSVRKIKND